MRDPQTKERQVLALLGRRDEPTDAVEEYCHYLRDALRVHDVVMEIDRVAWAEKGWDSAFRDLSEKARGWRSRWVVLQYTALAWSKRGFPTRFLKAIRTLQDAGARVGVVYHDVAPYAGERVVDKLRRRVQLRVMRGALSASSLAIVTVPTDVIGWIGRQRLKAIFIPVGANLPACSNRLFEREQGIPRVVVFGITGGETGHRECARIVEAVRFAAAKIGGLQLHAFGRHADDCGADLREGLRGTSVEVVVEGVLPPEQVVRELSSADVMLFVRGPISSRRGSAIAGIACGLPVIAYSGAETAAPIADAGVVMVSPENRAELGKSLVRVLVDPQYRASLAERSRKAHAQHFSWEAIALRYADMLKGLD